MRILIVDDELNIREGIAAALGGKAITASTARNGTEALQIVQKSQPFDVIVTDLKMPGSIDGLDFVREIRRVNADAALIVITAYGTVETAVEAMKLGAFDYLSKPIDLNHLRTVVRNAAEKQKLLQENMQLKRQLAQKQRLIAHSPQMLKVLDIVEHVAKSDVTVLLTGESGTGKEMIAREIHDRSPRSNKPFIGANCSALPASLFESEMFGHEKGAFTGAVKRHVGRFELANHGTLFLDEVTDMPLDYQVDLLRVLEEREIRRVGGEEVIKVDVRIVSATNRQPRQAVSEGRFREDLYYRLNVVPIELPPLRERRSDIPLLVDQFLAEFNPIHGKQVHLSQAALRRLTEHSWPGNVRELRNLLERLVVTAESDVLELQDLPGDLRSVPAPQGFDLESAVSEAERKTILAALEECNDHRQQAAELLGVSVRTLHYKLKKLGMISE